MQNECVKLQNLTNPFEQGVVLVFNPESPDQVENQQKQHFVFVSNCRRKLWFELLIHSN